MRPMSDRCAECTAMDAMCKPGLFATRIRPAFGCALHSRQPLSTASNSSPVQTVGNAGPNSGLFTGLPAFHFGSVQFSKTGRAAIHAARLVFSLLSTFPVPTVTTTKREYIFKAFHSSRDLCLPRTSCGVGWARPFSAQRKEDSRVALFLFQTGNPQKEHA
jgi:hypothetical protein